MWGVGPGWVCALTDGFKKDNFDYSIKSGLEGNEGGE